MGNARRKCFSCGIEGHFAKDPKFHPEFRRGISTPSGSKTAHYVPPGRANATRQNEDYDHDTDRGSERTHTLAGAFRRSHKEEEDDVILRLNATYLSDMDIQRIKEEYRIDQEWERNNGFLPSKN